MKLGRTGGYHCREAKYSILTNDEAEQGDMTYSSVTPNDAERVVDDNFRGIRSSLIATALSVSSSQVACGKSAAGPTSQP